jgi:phosphatidylglycerophosphate synthase
MKRDISGRRRKLTSFIQPFEQLVLRRMVPWVPRWIETYHLTLMTIPLALIMLACGYLARTNDLWLLPISLMIFLQYVTDILDGAVGRYRDTGLVLWGFYMDHMMDYLFAGAIVATYAIAYQLSLEFTLVAFILMSGFFIHAFLMCNAAGRLNTSGAYGFGPTELRLLLIVSNLAAPFLTRAIVAQWLPLVLPFSALILFWSVIKAQHLLWKLDMKHRDSNKAV